MRCANCGHHNQSAAHFCGNCGSSLADRSCPECGWSLSVQDKFCSGCGNAVGLGSVPVTRRSVPAENPDLKPVGYLPGHLAERILRSRATIEGERKQTTVLFADVVDSTRLTYGKDPEEAAGRLTPAIDAMRAAVFRYEGYVRPRGDGIQALFGVPIAHEDHAVRGCYAALDILQAISDLNRKLREETGDFVQVRVGLNSGEVLIKGIRDDLLLDIDVMGVTVALAARMESLTPPGTVQMTAGTLALAEGFVEAEGGDRIFVKGFNEPVQVYQLKAARSAPTRFHGIAARGLTRFVGRELEMETLAHVWEQARKGHGQVMAFVGEPGVGKSRLYWEFLHSSHLGDTLVMEASSVSYGKATPYLPLIDLLKKYFEIQLQHDERRIKEKINGKLVTLDESLLRLRAAIFALLGLGVDDPEWNELEPVQRRRRTIDAITGIVMREAQRQRVCLVFEDLHWVDDETEALLDNLAEALALAPIILLVNYRPDYQSHWSKKTYFTQLPLGPLPEQSAEELLDALLGRDDALSPLKDKLIELTEGNPFFLEESVQTLREQGVLTGDPGHVRLSRPITRIDVPVSVQATLEARIDRLDPDHKHLLHYAAVVGKIVPFAVLQDAVDLPEVTLRSGLSQLQSSEFVYETKLYPDREYTFKHALTYQVAYRTLPKERRRSMHSQIMRAMEDLSTRTETENIEQLAHHAFRGAVWDKAVRYSFDAGKKSYDRSANREAVEYLDQALSALEKLPESKESLRLAVDIRFLLRLALLNLGRVERIGKLLEETQALIVSLDDPARVGQLEGFLSNHYYLTCEQEKAIEHGRRAIEFAEKSESFALKAEMSYRLAQPLYQLAMYREAITELEKGLLLIGPEFELDRMGIAALPSVICRSWLSHCCAELGEFAKGLRYAREGVALAERAGHPLSIVFAHWGQGHLHLRQRDFARAILDYEKGLDVCNRWSLRIWFPRLASSVGAVRALTGHQDRALGLLQDAIETLEETRHSVDGPLLYRRLAMVYMMLDQFDRAETEALKALRLCVQGRARGQQAWTLRLLGDIHFASPRSNWEQAAAYYREALDLGHTLGMRPLSALCNESLGRLYEMQGRRNESEDAFEAASSILRDIGLQSAPPAGPWSAAPSFGASRSSPGSAGSISN